MICDTGHNVAGIQLILKQLSSMSYNQLHIVWGMVDDKDLDELEYGLGDEDGIEDQRHDADTGRLTQLLYRQRWIAGDESRAAIVPGCA